MTLSPEKRQALYRRTDELTESIACHGRCLARNTEGLSEYHLQALRSLTAEYDAAMAELGITKAVEHYGGLLEELEAEKDRAQGRAEDFRKPGDAA